MSYILTFSTNETQNSFLGVFYDLPTCREYMRENFKSLKKEAPQLRTNIVYVINCLRIDIDVDIKKPRGSFEIWSLKGDRLRKTVGKAYAYFNFIVKNSVMGDPDFEDKLEKLAKICKGLVTGSGTDFRSRDYSVEIPYANYHDFKGLLETHKLKPANINIFSPYSLYGDTVK